jgi:hypothetical protein
MSKIIFLLIYFYKFYKSIYCKSNSYILFDENLLNSELFSISSIALPLLIFVKYFHNKNLFVALTPNYINLEIFDIISSYFFIIVSLIG